MAMPFSVIELINGQMPKVQKTVDLTLQTVSSTGAIIEDGNPDPALDFLFPLVNYPDQMIALWKLRRYAPTLAYIVATDGEIPQDREKVTLTQEILGNLKLAKSRVWTEEDMELMHRAEMLTALGSAQAAQAIRDMFLATPAQLAQAVINLHTVLTMRLAVTGACLYEDPMTSLNAELSYKDQIPAGNLPAPLATNKRWSQLTTATGIADLVTHMNSFYDQIRRFPPYIVMGRKAANNLRMQNSTRELVARMRGVITEAGAVDPGAIANMEPANLDDVATAVGRRLSGQNTASGTTQIIVSDAVYYTRGRDGRTETKFYVPEDYYFFAFPGYIERAIVPTASNKFQGGLVTTTEQLSKEPPRERVAVAGRGLPLCPDPRLVGARNVENTAIA